MQVGITGVLILVLIISGCFSCIKCPGGLWLLLPLEHHICSYHRMTMHI